MGRRLRLSEYRVVDVDHDAMTSVRTWRRIQPWGHGRIRQLWQRALCNWRGHNVTDWGPRFPWDARTRHCIEGCGWGQTEIPATPTPAQHRDHVHISVGVAQPIIAARDTTVTGDSLDRPGPDARDTFGFDGAYKALREASPELTLTPYVSLSTPDGVVVWEGRLNAVKVRTLFIDVTLRIDEHDG